MTYSPASVEYGTTKPELPGTKTGLRLQPHEASLAVAQAWHRLRFAQKVYESEATEKFSKSRHRQERLKGLGNAWVPQVAIEIFKGIKQIDENMV